MGESPAHWHTQPSGAAQAALGAVPRELTFAEAALRRSLFYNSATVRTRAV